MNGPDRANELDKLQRGVARVFRVGNLLSSTLLALGLLLTIVHAPADWGETPLRIGLVILMATPVANVVLSGMEYVLERDWRFVGLTVLVLLILLSSLAVALGQRV